MNTSFLSEDSKELMKRCSVSRLLTLADLGQSKVCWRSLTGGVAQTESNC